MRRRKTLSPQRVLPGNFNFYPQEFKEFLLVCTTRAAKLMANGFSRLYNCRTQFAVGISASDPSDSRMMGRSWPSTQSDLIRNLRNRRDHASWKAFVDLYGPLLYRLCRRQQLQDADAADVVQNVLTRVSGAIENFDKDRGRFRSWLITITAHEIHRYRERTLERKLITDEAAIQSIETDLTAAWAVEFQIHIYELALERTRQHFDDDSWQAFIRCWIEKSSPATVAAEMNRKIQWVYREKRKVLQQLQQEVERIESDSALLSGEELD
jgi:RNA polymerase sigma-70 factor (ECF subfamily)